MKCSACHKEEQIRYKTKHLCTSCYHKDWRSKNPHYTRNRYRKKSKEQKERYNKLKSIRDRCRTHKITLLDYYAARSLGCEICRCDFTLGSTKHRQCFDHDHSTGKFRGFLCCECNSMLGKAQDRIEVLQKSIRYLLNS